jgi:putative ABC transport system substrate-binding protein
MIRRRNLLTLLGGAAAAWPVGAWGQQPQRMRRIGVFMNLAADDPTSQVRIAAFLQRLGELGWTVGRNVRIDVRWGGGDPAERLRAHAAELVALKPDVIMAVASPVVMAIQQADNTAPIVFVGLIDPVATGLVASLARPGGNATGFTQFEYALSGKWLELLKQIAPRVTRVAVLRDPTVAAGIGQFASIQAVASTLGVELTPVGLARAKDIEQSLGAFARQPSGGMIVTGSTLAFLHRDLIIRLAASHRLPAVYPYRPFADGGGLLAYGTDPVDEYRSAADYVDRVLKGEKPADLAVQAPMKYELVLNLKTARALGLTVPATLLARADEVIE